MSTAPESPASHVPEVSPPPQAEGQSQPAAPVQPAAPPRPKPKDIADEVASVIPSFATAVDPLTNVLTVFHLYIGSDDNPPMQKGVTREKALRQIGLRNWSEATLLADATAVSNALGDGWQEFTAHVQKATGIESQGDLIQEQELAKRLEQELAEQRDLSGIARSMIERSTHVRALLNIPITDKASTESAKDEKEGDRPRRAHGLAGLAGKLGGAAQSFLFETEKESEIISQPLVAKEKDPTWDTPPVIAEDNPTIERFEIVHEQVTSDSDASTVKDTLEMLGITNEGLLFLLSDVEDLARKQIAQSDEIVKRVTAENRDFADEAHTLQNVRLVLKQVINFFGLRQPSNGQ